MFDWLLDWLFPKPSRQADAVHDKCPDCTRQVGAAHLDPSGCRCVECSGNPC